MGAYKKAQAEGEARHVRNVRRAAQDGIWQASVWVPITKATHVMILANCPASTPAHEYAHEVMANSNLAVLILDKPDFERIQESPGSIATVLEEKSDVVSKIRRHGLDWLS